MNTSKQSFCIWCHTHLFSTPNKLFLHVLPFLSLRRLGVWGTLQFWGGGPILHPNLLSFWTKISLTKLCKNNFQTSAIIWVGFLGVCFEVVVVGELSHLKLWIMLETSNLAHKYRHVNSENIPLSTQTLKNQYSKIPLLKAILWELC